MARAHATHPLKGRPYNYSELSQHIPQMLKPFLVSDFAMFYNPDLRRVSRILTLWRLWTLGQTNSNVRDFIKFYGMV